MASKFDKIKSKYTIRKIFSFLTINDYIKAIYISKKLSSKLLISKETFKKFSEMKKMIKPNFNIENYLPQSNNNYKEEDKNKDYDSNISKNNEISELNESISYWVLSNLSFTIPINFKNKYWKLILRNISNIRIEIHPLMINYLLDIGKEAKEDIFTTLRLYNKNIKEICICNFCGNNNLNYQNLNYITNLITCIYGNDIKEINLASQYNNVINKDNNGIKKLSFFCNSIPIYVDFYGKFLDKISKLLFYNDISKMNIEEFVLGLNPFEETNFKDINNFIINNAPNLKSLEVGGLAENIDNYYILENILQHSMNLIHLNLGNSPVSFFFLILALNEYKNPLKFLSLRIVYSDENEIKWSFLDKSINSLETLEIILISSENYIVKFINEMHDDCSNMSQLIDKINKMTQLKKLQLISDSEYYKYHIRNLNNTNIQYLDIKLFGNNEDKLEYIADFKFLSRFQKIIGLSIKEDKNILLPLSTNDDYRVKEYYKLTKKDVYIFPETLTSLKLTDFEFKSFDCLFPLRKNLLSIFLQYNEDNLNRIEELIIQNCLFDSSFFQDFLKISRKMKSNIQLSDVKVSSS